MKISPDDIYDFETICKMSLNDVDRLYHNGLISDDYNEAYYHLWRQNPHLMGYHPICQCGICERKRKANLKPIGYYMQGGKVEFYETREPKLEYYNPMAHELVKDHIETLLQVKVRFLGELMWINVNRNSVVYYA